MSFICIFFLFVNLHNQSYIDKLQMVPYVVLENMKCFDQLFIIKTVENFMPQYSVYQ